MAQKPHGLTRAWFDKAAMAGAFDVSPNIFDRDYRRFAPATAVKEVGGKLYFHSRTILDAWVRQQKAKLPADADPLLNGGDSPALEEYRKHRARSAKVEADEKERISVPRAILEPALRQSAGVMRRVGETLARRFGNEAGDIYNEGVDRVEETIRSICENDGHDLVAAGDEDTSPAHDAGIR